MARYFGHHIPLVISLFVLAATVILHVWNPVAVSSFQLKVFDMMQVAMPREYTPQPVKIVDIDDESLSRIGQWPWPRNDIAQLIENLTNAGAAAIAFDIVFAEPDRASPHRIISVLPGHLQSSKLKNMLADYDAMLANTIAESTVITGFALTPDKIRNSRLPEVKAGFSYVGQDPHPHVTSYYGAVTSLPMLEVHASGNGALNSLPDQDGILRRMPLFYKINNQLYPTLSAEALRVAQGASTYIVKSTGASDEAGFGADSGITAVKVGAFEIPTDKAGQFWIHFTPFQSERYISAWQILAGNFDPSLVEGNIVFIGTSAAGLKDIRTTPVNPVSSGVEVHVQAIEQVLTHHYLTRPNWAHGAEIVWIMITGVVLIIMMAKLSAIYGAFYCSIAFLGAGAISYYSFAHFGVLVDAVSPGIAIIVLYFTESLSKYISTEREKQNVRDAFGLYMSPALVEELAANPEKLTLGGETKELTILFCDIRGFTTISEQFDAQGLIQFINRFLTPMTSVILDHKGTIDKYMGDAIMAFWNAPLDDPDHAYHACISALEMMTELKKLNEVRQENAKQEGREFIPINIGIGLNTGECCVGNMGSEHRFDYSILGDDVNLASRLEGQSKHYGTNIIIGEYTNALVSGLATLELDLIQVKGKTVPVKVYALLGDEALNNSLAFKALENNFRKVLLHYRTQEWTQAEAVLQTCRQNSEKISQINLGGLFSLYEQRIKLYREQALPANWNGVYEATAK